MPFGLFSKKWNPDGKVFTVECQVFMQLTSNVACVHHRRQLWFRLVVGPNFGDQGGEYFYRREGPKEAGQRPCISGSE